MTWYGRINLQQLSDSHRNLKDMVQAFFFEN